MTEDLNEVPLSHSLNLRLEHVIDKANFYQTKFTKQLVTIQTFVVSHEHVVVLVQAQSIVNKICGNFNEL